MNVKLSQAEKIQVLNGNDICRIMQRVLRRENKIDRGYIETLKTKDQYEQTAKYAGNPR